MRRLISIAALILITGFAFGQKRNVTSCWSLLDDGFLEDAYEKIDKASKHPKTENWYKTWWYYGQTYQQLSVTKKEKYQDLCTNCADSAFDAYIKSMKLNFEDPEYKKIDLESQAGVMKFMKAVKGSLQDNDPKLEDKRAMIDILQTRLPALANGFVNKGIKLFQEKEYNESLNQFEKSLTISSLTMRADTQVYYFASLSAINAKDFEKALQYNKVLKQMDYGKDNETKALVALNLAISYKHTGDTANYISTIKEGVEKYPDNSYDMVIELFNFHLGNKDYDRALKYINLAIEQNPKSSQFYGIKGTLFEEMNNQKKAVKAYEKAIELDSTNFDANYNLGAYFYNYAADTLAWASDNIPPTETQKYQAVKDEANKYFKKARPHLERARELDENNINVLRTLKTIYYRLGEMEKHNEIKEKIKSLTE